MQIEQETIATLQQYFAKQPVLRAYLFGSFARGEADEQSDIDLLVELDYSQRVGMEFIQMQIDLQHLLARKVDLVSAKGLSKYVQPLVDQEKQLIYAR